MTTETSRSNPVYSAPEFRGETSMSALLDPACWINVPRIRRFRVRKTDNFLTAGDMTAMAAHKNGMIYIYAECDRDDEDFDLDAVPDDVLILLLNCGCCPAQLAHHLAEGDVIYAVE